MSPPSSQPTPPRTMMCRDRRIAVGGDPVMVGILNVTPDSFSDGGRYNTPESALAQAELLVAEGADMIDIGGESTRPGHVTNASEIPLAPRVGGASSRPSPIAVSAEEEIARILPVIGMLASRLRVPLSVDTYKSAVARAALGAGAHLINDIHGLQGDPEMARVAAEFGCPAIVMHNDAAFRETPGDLIGKMKAFFRRSLAIADHAGVDRGGIILDPGIGFAKTTEQNLEILGRLAELKSLGFPVLLGASRKSVVGNVLSLPPEERLEGTLAITALAVWQDVDFIRVHDVRANLRAARIARAIRRASPL